MKSNYKTKLANARCRIIITDPWYGVITSRFIWINDPSVSTMGVRIRRLGKVECLYNPDFVNSLSNDQLIAVVKHEIEHIIRGHISRSLRYKNNINLARIMNMAADWVINGSKNDPRIKNLPLCGTFIPDKDNPFIVNSVDCGIPNQSSTTEEFFNWILEKLPENHFGCGDALFDNHDVWSTGDASADDIRNTAKNLASIANTATAGNSPGHLKSFISELQKADINWTNVLRNHVGRNAGGKRYTYYKRNRKRDKFGIKGYSKKNRVPLTIMIDTSGSVSDKMLGKFFSEIENASRNYKIKIIEFDHEVQSVKDYHRGDWKNIKVSGRGGTSFVNCLDYIENNGLVGKMNILLTDGEADVPSPRPYPFLWVIIGDSSDREFWGDVIKLKEDYIDN